MQFIRIKLRAEQANAGDGGDDHYSNSSEDDHGDLLSQGGGQFYIFNAVLPPRLRFSPNLLVDLK
jgi:hypothetical protein